MNVLKKLICVWLIISIFSHAYILPMELLEKREEVLSKKDSEFYFYRGHGWHTCMYVCAGIKNAEKYANTVHAFMKEIGLIDKDFDCKGVEAELKKCKVESV